MRPDYPDDHKPIFDLKLLSPAELRRRMRLGLSWEEIRAIGVSLRIRSQVISSLGYDPPVQKDSLPSDSLTLYIAELYTALRKNEELELLLTELDPYTQLYQPFGDAQQEVQSLIAQAAQDGRKTLNLNCHGLHYLPSELATLTQLEELNLAGNDLDGLGQETCWPPNLTTLNLTCCDIKYLSETNLEAPGSLTNLQYLKILNLSRNELTTLPESFGSLQKLEKLDLVYNQLESLPESLGKLSNLSRLSLSNNKIGKLPESLGELSNLSALDLSNNEIGELPESLGKLSNLSRLDLSNNEIGELPESLGKLSNLDTLDLSNNEIGELPESLGKLSNLWWLDLSNNEIGELSESLSNLSNLDTLDLSDNEIGELPESLSKLSNLSRLDLSNNEIGELPESLGKLSNLSALYVRNNEIGELPESLSKLSNLKILDLSNNQITKLPSSLKELQNLRFLFLVDNPLTPSISPEFLQRAFSPEEILNFYFQAITATGRKLNEIKLLVVGQATVGKTSLVKRLTTGDFDPNEKMTEGIKVENWPVVVTQVAGEQGSETREVTAHIWDFGGQEIMHATHQFFLTKRSLYLVVIDARQGEEQGRLDYWLQTVKNFGSDSPVLVIVNKVDIQKYSLDEGGLQKKYPAIKGFLKVSCQTGKGIEALKEAIVEEIVQLPHVDDVLPEAWFNVKQELETRQVRDQENYLSYTEFETICEREQIDAQSWEMLIGLLHDLGTVLCFRGDKRLKDNNVLNPEWVTTGVYQIINSSLLSEQEGELHLNDLDKILTMKDGKGKLRYPSDKHTFIIDMMLKFELCFQHEHERERVLVPELLAKETPDRIAHYQSLDALRFNYEYQFLPSSIISRFIVRMKNRVHQKLYWRRGVVLASEDGQNFAVVRADLEAKELSIIVTGPTTKRRYLLRDIRSELYKIHKTISGLEWKEWIPLPQYQDKVEYKRLLNLVKKGETRYLPMNSDDFVAISDLLFGIDEFDEVEENRKEQERLMSEAEKSPVKLFISYSHKDEEMCKELKDHLTTLERQQLIEFWYDRNIDAGDEFDAEIKQRLEAADIILLLVSSAFVASKYIWNIELKRAMERHEAQEARVIPVILRPVDWQETTFSKLKALPKDGKPITDRFWASSDEAYADVAKNIREIVKKRYSK
jgi:internalin A